MTQVLGQVNDEHDRHGKAEPLMRRNPRERGQGDDDVGDERHGVDDELDGHGDHRTFRMMSARAITSATGMSIQRLRLASEA